jgi:UDP-glucose:(glucosyl)LPS alpha-1,2-glucosyltransferase
MGGTELILGHLKTALPELTEQVQIICSRPEQYKLDDTKPKVLWLQDLPMDPASACLRDAGYRKQFNRIVFVSHWQQQMYQAYLGIPFSEGIVLKNAVPRLSAEFPKPKTDGKLRFIYTSTPHRGLGVLAASVNRLVKERQDWQLDVFSSFSIYGVPELNKQFEPLYDALRANPCVVYHGSQPNAVVREAVKEAHVFVYPAIYMETSCMAIQEAMMAGCLAITTNYGALIETCGEWAWMMGYSENPETIAHQTWYQMTRALERYDDPFVQDVLQTQSVYYQQFYSFEARVPAWRSVLEQCVAEGPKVETFIVP